MRLGEIIIAPRPEALDPVVDLAERREDEHRRFVLLAAQRADQGQPVHFRQHAVDDGDVVTAVERHVVAAHAVVGDIDHMSGFAKGLRQIGGGVAVVFDDEDLHGAPY